MYYNNFPNGNQNNNQNAFYSMFGGKQNFDTQFSNFANQMKNINPEEKVRSMLQSGQMTQEQFNRFRDIANMITGKNM